MSSINPNNIDGTYPIAGQDNDSQGFRDNFTNIKNNFTFAYNELTDLQDKVVLKSSLSGGTVDNNLNYTQFIAPQLIKAVETKNDLGTITGSSTISWADGHFQYFITSGSVTLAFSNWPTSGYYTKLRIQANVASTSHTITFPSAVSVGLENIQGANATSRVVTFTSTGLYQFELTSYDNGTTIAIEDVLRNYDNAGEFSVTGNLTTAGARVVNGTTFYTANTGFVQTIGATTERYVISPWTSNIIANGTLTLPGANVNSTVVTISAVYGVTALQVLPSNGTVLKPSANITLANGSAATYMYRSADTAWYKIG